MSMANEGHGLLLASMEPPAGLEEEFQDWYDNEHVPERTGIEGVLSGVRLVCVEGWPRYVALYDLKTVSVLDSEGYRAVSGDNFSPWSKRILSKVRGQYRAAGVQVYPGDAVSGRFASMTLLRYRAVDPAREGELIEAALAAAAGRDERQAGTVRVYRVGDHGQTDYLVMIDWSHGPAVAAKVVPPPAFAALLDLVNTYVPYWKHGHLPGVYSKA
ncbi:MAG: hypothetical protein H7332_13680 [Bdellovibrionales bacterium]|nr:hypothetical protein [Ramlibacter sp.]